ncbi:MAG: fibrobacter succinogenes major paralogous domain-containing protein [Prevotellaceae bacterium]|jgi:hypothetical protein|nr:fibrobacter succinogenes major paralogous domain-containing protein [Prevotellaceae bacterium]
MKTNLFLFAALAAAFLSVAPFMAAQVTIGGSDAPKAGTILDLNSTTKGGLQLSNVNFTGYTTIPVGFPGINIPGDVTPAVKAALTGAVVYNVNHDFGMGIFVWDGNRWQPIGTQQIYSTVVSAPTCSHAVPDVTFMDYNLGADVAKLNALYPELSPAKQQIRFLADCTVPNAVTVFGDMYQWGRMRDGHEKLDAVAYGGDGNTTNQGALSGTALDATTGQVVDDTAGAYEKNSPTQAYGHFIKSNASGLYDWCSPTKNDLWGNGEILYFNFGSADGGAVESSSGGYYQKPVKTVNDPCPSGWRVPTQDELERLINYDCKSNNVGGIVLSIPSTGKTTTTRGGNELTWVPVAGGVATNYSGWAGTTGNLGGFAVYKTADWDDAVAADYKNGIKNLYETAAPEPLLFFPAVGTRDRSDGSFYDVGTQLRYWSSTAGTPDPHILFFGYGSVSTIGNSRAEGSGMRCVKE